MAIKTATVVEDDFFAGWNDSEIFEYTRRHRLQLAKRYAKKGDILRWGRLLFPHKFTIPFCTELHGYFVKIRGEEFTNTEAPRGRAKTTIKCFLIPTFQALNEPDTFRHYLNVQATEKKALDVNRSIRAEIETNELLRELYGNQIGGRWTDQQFVLKNGIAFTAIGAGQSIRGLNYRNVRPDYVIVDDLYDDEDIYNSESTEKKNDWFWSALYPALSQSKRTSLHIQGTAINAEDLMEQLKKNEKVKSRTFQAIKDWDKKEVLWPELKTFEEMMGLLENMPITIFYREYQNERRDEASAIVKRSWLKDWEAEPEDLYAKVREGKDLLISAILLGNDPSIGEKVENDFTGTALVIKFQQIDGAGNIYLIEGLWNEHLSQHERIEQLKTIAGGRPVDYSLTQIRIESIAGFKDYAAEVIRVTNLPVQMVPEEGTALKDKIANLENKSHYFQNKKIFLNKNIEDSLKKKLIDQLTRNHPRNDDLRDAVLLCLDDTSGMWRFV